MIASQEGHLSVVELLVSVGAQVNSQNNVSHLGCRYTHTGFSNKTKHHIIWSVKSFITRGA